MNLLQTLLCRTSHHQWQNGVIQAHRVKDCREGLLLARHCASCGAYEFEHTRLGWLPLPLNQSKRFHWLAEARV